MPPSEFWALWPYEIWWFVEENLAAQQRSNSSLAKSDVDRLKQRIREYNEKQKAK
ncbi:hypothetical protein [Teredinibacter turnerae]|uniref:hypothetical protein n=1 Tax=Teredinibacter turnerae TaxID=2426 RepID=UPI0030CAE70B